MKTSQASTSTRFKVGIFTLLGLALVGVATVFVNDTPFWWRPCQFVRIKVQDASGLRSQSPVRSLGLQIGYLKSVELSETYVSLGICITAPVEILPSTRAYIRGEGFLGDKYLELKPVKYLGEKSDDGHEEGARFNSSFLFDLIPSAYAEEPQKDQPTEKRDPAFFGAEADAAPSPAPSPRARRAREVRMGEDQQDIDHLIGQVDDMVTEMTELTNTLKQAINPEDLRQTMKQLNKTLENASHTLSPQGGLTTTAQRALAKLEDSIEQLRDILTRINKGEGSVGMLINDPTYAEEIKGTIQGLNKLLAKINSMRFSVDLGAEYILGYNAVRSWFKVSIWPNPKRYYVLGVSFDPRGQISGEKTTTTVTANGQTSTFTSDSTTLKYGGFVPTVMIGKIFWDRIDLAVGAIHGDGGFSAALYVGPRGQEWRYQLIAHGYARGQGVVGGDMINGRLIVQANPISSVYFRAGVESFKQVEGKLPFLLGGGFSFDDEDIKLLFAALR